MGESIRLQPITAENWKAAISLSVSEEQNDFVASNLYSIAQAQYLPDFKSVGIYADETMVGYALYGIDADDGNYWIYRLMIDKAHQGKGYGKAMLQKVLEDIHQDNTGRGIPYVVLGFNPANTVAKELYISVGFVETEMASWGEQLARLELKVTSEIISPVVHATTQHQENYKELAHALWPESLLEELEESFQEMMTSSFDKILFYQEKEELVAFMHLSVRRDYVEGTESSPTGYVEGVYVKPEYRRKGYSQKLLAVGEEWLKAKGCRQIGSDIHLDNDVSYHFHTSLGFKEASRLIAFIKDIK